jgi:hypothetical protein
VNVSERERERERESKTPPGHAAADGEKAAVSAANVRVEAQVLRGVVEVDDRPLLGAVQGAEKAHSLREWVWAWGVASRTTTQSCCT